MSIQLQRCPYCGNEDIRIIWPKADFWQCSFCQLFFKNPMPTEKELIALYQYSWNNPEKHGSETGGTDSRLAKMYTRCLAYSLGRKDFSGMRILDFGAGKGLMVKALSALGARVCAVEPYGYKYLQAKGIKVYKELSEINNSFHGIVTIDVWEHLLRPWEILRKLKALLVNGGWIYIATANPLGLNARIKKDKWREAKKAGHLMFPAPHTMERMLKDIGFTRFRRLKWFIRYHKFPRWMLDYALQEVYLDGELRYLAWK